MRISYNFLPLKVECGTIILYILHTGFTIRTIVKSIFAYVDNVYIQ